MICPACRNETEGAPERCPRCGEPLPPPPRDRVHLSSDDETVLQHAAPADADGVTSSYQAAPPPQSSSPATSPYQAAPRTVPGESSGASRSDVVMLSSDDATMAHPSPHDSDAGVTVPFQAAPFRLSPSPVLPDTPPPSSGPPTGGPARPVQPALSNGTLGRYRIVRLLGAGGMGEVYEAYDEELGERVALKLIRPDFARSADADARFRRELSVARQVTHRNVVRIHDLGVADGRKFISMSFVDGEDLATIMGRGRLPRGQALSIAEQVCAGLSAAHQAGIVHRDLKPANIMVDASGRAYLMDFGLARSMEETQFTQVGMVLGTLDYMSPEQATGDAVDQRSDIYSLGLILYELLAGERPFKGESSMNRLTARLHKPAPDPRLACADLEPYLANVVLRCLERDPKQRYQDVDAVLADLAARRGRSGRWRRARGRLSSGPVWKAAAAAAVVVLAAAIGAALFLRQDAPASAASAARPVAAPQVSLAIVPFRNASGDASLDWLGASLGEMLGADVGQSSAVRTVSSSRLQPILLDLAVPADAAIDPATLRRLAEFSNADTLVWGQYVRAGEQIRIDATVQNLKESRTLPLASEVTTEKDVLAAVDRLARSIRAAVTTSPDVLRELGASAFRPSTSSIPALRAYNEGLQLSRRGNHQDAVKRLAESVAADPSFALAHSQLALGHASLGQDDQAEASSRRAVGLAASLPAREKYLIQANHARIINDNVQAVQAYEQLARVSPDDADVQFALGGLHEGMGALDEARKDYENVLVRDPKHVEALLSIGRVHIKQQDPQASLDFLNRALTLSIEMSDTEEKGRILHTIGVAYKRLNKPEDALRYYREAMDIRRGIGQKNGIAATLSELADVQRTLGRPAEALASYREALGLQREIGDRRGAGVTSLNLGVFLMDRGSYDEALTLFRGALQVNRDSGDEGGQARALNNIGAVYFWMGRYEDALTYYQQALALREKLKIPADVAETVHNLGEASERIGQYDEAVSRYLRALELYRGAGDKLNAGIESDAIGTIFQAQGRYGAALKVKTEALKSVRDAGESGYWAAKVLGGYGQALTLVGRAAEAEQPLREAETIARGLGSPALVAQVLIYQGDRFFYSGDEARAGRLYREAAKQAAGLSDQRLQLVARLGEARAAIEGGRAATATVTLQEVAVKAGELGLKDVSAEGSLYIGQALLARKDWAAARRQLEDALSRAERLGMAGLQARAHFLQARAHDGAGETADAAGHMAQARRLVAEMTKEARSEALASRSDLAPISSR